MERDGQYLHTCKTCQKFTTHARDAGQLLRHLDPCLAKQVLPRGGAGSLAEHGAANATPSPERLNKYAPILARSRPSIPATPRNDNQRVIFFQCLAVYNASQGIPFEKLSKNCEAFPMLVECAEGSRSLVPESREIAEAMEKEAQSIREEYKTRLQHEPYFHIVLDQWADDGCCKRFVSVLACAARTPPMVLDVFTLEGRERTAVSTVVNFARSVCEKYAIAKKLTAVLCDGDANPAEMASLLPQEKMSCNFVHTPCAPRFLSRVLPSLAFSEESDETKAKMREMVAYVFSIPDFMLLLERFCPGATLQAFDPTCWQSILESAQCLVQCKPSLYALAATDRISPERTEFILDEAFWERLQAFVTVASSTWNIIHQLSCDESHARDVIPLAGGLATLFEKFGCSAVEARGELDRLCENETYVSAYALSNSHITKSNRDENALEDIVTSLEEKCVLTSQEEVRAFSDENFRLVSKEDGVRVRRDIESFVDGTREGATPVAFWSTNKWARTNFSLVSHIGSLLCSVPSSLIPFETRMREVRNGCRLEGTTNTSTTVAACALVRAKHVNIAKPDAYEDLWTMSNSTSCDML